MQGTFRFILIAFWLFALTAPSMLTLLDLEGSKLVLNLNEEDAEESTFSTFDEEQWAIENYFALFHPIQTKKIELTSIGWFIGLDHTLEVVLPPPEPLV